MARGVIACKLILYLLPLVRLQLEKEGKISNELAVVVSSTALACKQIASLVNRAGISNLTGVAGAQNVQVRMAMPQGSLGVYAELLIFAWTSSLDALSICASACAFIKSGAVLVSPVSTQNSSLPPCIMFPFPPPRSTTVCPCPVLLLPSG